MPWVQLIVETASDKAERLSDLLTENGAMAVTLQDDADQPLYEPPVGETPLWQQTRLVGLFPAEEAIEPVVGALEHALSPDPMPRWRTEILEDQEWSRAWMDQFEPMAFGKRLWIVPSWCDPTDPDAVNISLDPGLAFGTGTHPTTRLCLEWLDANPPVNARVIDFGSGSGILAIAAAKLGAAHVLAVDNDPQALLATRENAARNGVAARITTASPDQGLGGPADLVLANILAGPLIALAPTLSSLTRKGGSVVLSGVLREHANSVLESYGNWYNMNEPVILEDWVRLEGARR